MLSGLGKIKNGVQKYFGSSEDSNRKETGWPFLSSPVGSKMHRKKRNKHPVSRSSFYVDAPCSESNELGSATLLHDIGNDKVNTESDSGLLSAVCRRQNVKKRPFCNDYENVCIGTFSVSSCPSGGLRSDIPTPQQPTYHNQSGGGAQPLIIWNRCYISEKQPTFQQQRTSEIKSGEVAAYLPDKDFHGDHYLAQQDNVCGSRKSQVYKWYFGMFENGTDQHPLGQTVWKPIDEFDSEHKLSSRKRDSLVPGFVPVTEL